MNRAALIGIWLAFSLCLVARGESKSHLPYSAWRLGFLAPPNMEVWTEEAIVEDIHDRRFYGYESGTVSMGYNPNAATWPRYVGWGAGRYVTGAALPKRIYVRWQSLVEPQTYSVTLEIPEFARQQMLLQAPALIGVAGLAHDPEYYNAVAIGLAPGGIVRVWITGPGLEAIPMMCVKAQVEPKGPYGGQSNGKYRPLTAKPQAYLQAHPIPYGTWGC
ncbi:DUF2931 family protein [Dyella acidiphila]|uniref:DUF2931 family protein n=1 Tax=Dyella acidiphila TaxID=2775866 RepID=A0ABR9GDW6_9GAMM|nr:DUF2931 family protein [Dyella acidiphila]MBE1162242.1 DUF2931 family protein [Dyella acidiphila]